MRFLSASSIRVFFRRLRFLGGSIVLVLALAIAGCGGNESGPEPGRVDVDLAAPPDTMTVDRILRTDDRFSTLVAALDSVGLDSTLASDGPYTLFAPPDTAFAALPPGTMQALFTDEQAQLRRILAHHVVEGAVPLAALTDTSALITLAGDTLRVRVTDSTRSVGAAGLLDGDVQGVNGRIHVIDGVLRPPPAEDESAAGPEGP